uniref:Transmembrane protein 44 n=1 Tax=Mola mola TaxID=94237 RepID=A0A3Q3W5A2_MOLML
GDVSEVFPTAPVCVCVCVCVCPYSERRLRVMRSRRRQHILAVCALMVVTGGFLQPRVAQLPAERPLTSTDNRDNTEILGYILGLLSLVIACTCRFPAIRSAHRGQMLTQVHLCSGLLSSLAGALYAAAILLSDIQFGFLLRAMPWLLSATCCATLDLLVSLLSEESTGHNRSYKFMKRNLHHAIRHDRFCSSDTSFDSSLSSDLEVGWE